MASIRIGVTALLVAAILPLTALAAPPGAVISNRATLEYLGVDGRPASADSNAVELRAAA